jgi:hypothetical protein
MIRNLQKKELVDFGGGRVTSENHAVIPETDLLIARNILVHSGAIQAIPGYELLQQIDGMLNVKHLYDFQRQTDDVRYLVAAGTNADSKMTVSLSKFDGSVAPQILSETEDNADYTFAQNVHTLYLNGATAKKVVNVDGVETLVPLGLKEPGAAPSIVLGKGRLLLEHGRRYIYCEVFRWTDSLGVKRFHVSAPSDFSAHTGPMGRKVTDGVATAASASVTSATATFEAGDVGSRIIVAGAGPGGADLDTTVATYVSPTSITVTDLASTTVAGATIKYHLGAVTTGNLFKRNSHTTHFWIFTTVDSVIDTTDAYYFAAEVTAEQAGWVDELFDSDLDTSREAPFDNLPPPEGASIMVDYQDRLVFIVGDKVYFSAFDEIALGQPQECYPASLQFRIPGGVLDVTAMKLFKIGDTPTLMLATEDYWFQVSGATADSFSKRDKIISPGAVGQRPVCEIHGKLVWLATDKKLWSWTGAIGDDPVPASISIHASAVDAQMSMNELDSNYLRECDLVWYTNGTFDFAVLFAASINASAGEKDWLQMWDLSPIVGIKTIQGPLPNPILTDFFPADMFSTGIVAKEGGFPYIYIGDAVDGSIYRWPKGTTFHETALAPAVGTPWIKIAEGKLRYFWLKFLTDMPNAYQYLKAFVQIGNGTSRVAIAEQIELMLAPDDENLDDTVAKGMIPDTREGEWIKVFLQLPEEPITIDVIEIAYKQQKRV